jgi:hypothetical protein
MYYKVNNCIGLPWENKNLPLVPKKEKLDSKNDEAWINQNFHLFLNLQFHLQGIDDPDES